MNDEDFYSRVEDIDNVIFDFGGIFLNINYDLAAKSLSELSSLKAPEQIYDKKTQARVFDDFEIGIISPDQFISKLKSMLVIKSDHSAVAKAWCQMLQDIPVKRVEFLKKVALKKRIFLLSNINKIHEDYLSDYIESSNELKGFYKIFEKVYFSHHLGMRKPNVKIFEHVVKENKLDVAKTLFMDDSPQHIEGAKEIGLQTVLLTPQNSFITY
jgi:glucose-1-phosphatase